MKTSIYKLGEYKIIEHNNGELNWEAHVGLGYLHEGRCFKKGSILFICPAENERPGFLMLEFTDHLKRLPEWMKTEYFCTSLEIYHCKTGKKVSEEEMNLWRYDRRLCGRENVFSDNNADDLNNTPISNLEGDNAFQLHRYEIIKSKNGQFIWNSFSGPNVGKGGTCTLLESILFIGPTQNVQSGFIKRQFLNDLNRLPEWGQSKYYCPKFILHECKAINRIHGKKKKWRSDNNVDENNYTERGDKNGTELKKPRGKEQKVYFGKTSAVLYSFFSSTAGQVNSKGLSQFIINKPDISKNKAMFCASGIKKWPAVTVGLIMLTILLILLFLHGHWNGRKGQWNYNKKEYPSSQRTHR